MCQSVNLIERSYSAVDDLLLCDDRLRPIPEHDLTPYDGIDDHRAFAGFRTFSRRRSDQCERLIELDKLK